MHSSQRYFAIALGLFALHELEEFVTHFYSIDPFTLAGAEMFRVAPAVLFGAVQLIGFGFLVAGVGSSSLAQRTLFRSLLVLLCLFELTHVIPALSQASYYPGVITASGLVLYGLFLLRQLLQKEPRGAPVAH